MARSVFLRKLHELKESDVLRIGALRDEIVRWWTDQVAGNQDIVLTGKQRAHYLARHPQMVAWEELLAETVLDPDEVHRNRRDPQVALFYKQVDGEHYLRATVVMKSTPSKFKHSVITFRVARGSEVEQNQHRLVWKKR